MSINLKEALVILNENDPEIVMNDDRLNEFVCEVDNAGVQILSPLDDKLVLGAIGLIQSSAISVISVELMEQGDFITAMKVMELCESDIFSKLITVAMKMSVGLAAVEEWR